MALGCVPGARKAAEEVGELPKVNCTYALRDIAVGEELVDDYNTYGQEPAWYMEVLEKHGVDTGYMHRDKLLAPTLETEAREKLHVTPSIVPDRSSLQQAAVDSPGYQTPVPV